MILDVLDCIYIAYALEYDDYFHKVFFFLFFTLNPYSRDAEKAKCMITLVINSNSYLNQYKMPILKFDLVQIGLDEMICDQGI